MAAKKKTKDTSRPDVEALRALSAEDLRGKLAEQRQELLSMRFQHATAQLEKTSELKSARRQVARIQTVLNEKE